jgi:hypothetical protein
MKWKKQYIYMHTTRHVRILFVNDSHHHHLLHCFYFVYWKKSTFLFVFYIIVIIYMRIYNKICRPISHYWTWFVSHLPYFIYNNGCVVTILDSIRDAYHKYYIIGFCLLAFTTAVIHSSTSTILFIKVVWKIRSFLSFNKNDETHLNFYLDEMLVNNTKKKVPTWHHGFSSLRFVHVKHHFLLQLATKKTCMRAEHCCSVTQ